MKPINGVQSGGIVRPGEIIPNDINPLHYINQEVYQGQTERSYSRILSRRLDQAREGIVDYVQGNESLADKLPDFLKNRPIKKVVTSLENSRLGKGLQQSLGRAALSNHFHDYSNGFEAAEYRSHVATDVEGAANTVRYSTSAKSSPFRSILANLYESNKVKAIQETAKNAVASLPENVRRGNQVFGVDVLRITPQEASRINLAAGFDKASSYNRSFLERLTRGNFSETTGHFAAIELNPTDKLGASGAATHALETQAFLAGAEGRTPIHALDRLSSYKEIASTLFGKGDRVLPSATPQFSSRFGSTKGFANASVFEDAATSIADGLRATGRGVFNGARTGINKLSNLFQPSIYKELSKELDSANLVRAGDPVAPIFSFERPRSYVTQTLHGKAPELPTTLGNTESTLASLVGKSGSALQSTGTAFQNVFGGPSIFKSLFTGRPTLKGLSETSLNPISGGLGFAKNKLGGAFGDAADILRGEGALGKLGGLAKTAGRLGTIGAAYSTYSDLREIGHTVDDPTRLGLEAKLGANVASYGLSPLGQFSLLGGSLLGSGSDKGIGLASEKLFGASEFSNNLRSTNISTNFLADAVQKTTEGIANVNAAKAQGVEHTSILGLLNPFASYHPTVKAITKDQLEEARKKLGDRPIKAAATTPPTSTPLPDLKAAPSANSIQSQAREKYAAGLQNRIREYYKNDDRPLNEGLAINKQLATLTKGVNAGKEDVPGSISYYKQALADSRKLIDEQENLDKPIELPNHRGLTSQRVLNDQESSKGIGSQGPYQQPDSITTQRHNDLLPGQIGVDEYGLPIFDKKTKDARNSFISGNIPNAARGLIPNFADYDSIQNAYSDTTVGALNSASSLQKVLSSKGADLSQTRYLVPSAVSATYAEQGAQYLKYAQKLGTAGKALGYASLVPDAVNLVKSGLDGNKKEFAGNAAATAVDAASVALPPLGLAQGALGLGLYAGGKISNFLGLKDSPTNLDLTPLSSLAKSGAESFFAKGLIPNFADLAPLGIAPGSSRVIRRTTLSDDENAKYQEFLVKQQQDYAQKQSNIADAYANSQQGYNYAPQGRFNQSRGVGGFAASVFGNIGGLSGGGTFFHKTHGETAFDRVHVPNRTTADLILSGLIGGDVNGQNLQDSIDREKDALNARGYYASGLIQVGYSPRIGGLGVYNKIDEPFGLEQGVNRVARQGGDPRTAGVPNFADTNNELLAAIQALHSKIGSATPGASSIDVNHSHQVQLSVAGEVRSSNNAINGIAAEEFNNFRDAIHERVRDLEVSHSKVRKDFVLRPS